MTLEEQKLLKEAIKGMVRESIFDIINGGMSEKKFGSGSKQKKNNKKTSDKKEKHRKHKEEKEKHFQDYVKDYDTEKDSKIRDKKRKRIIQYLKDEKTDIAPYAYELWPDKDEDSARSYFYKCLDGKTNDNGDVYSFSDDEFNRLHAMITDRKMK